MGFEYVGKRYKLHSSDKMDEFAVAVGLSEEMRNLIKTIIPTIEITQEGDTYTINTYTSLKNLKSTFKSGVEYEHTTIEGQKINKLITINGNKIIEEHKGSKPVSIIHEFSDDELKVIYQGGGVVATRIFKPE